MTLQEEIYQWHKRNYPNDDANISLLSLMEEFGELCRTHVKQAGGIRGTSEFWQKEKFKELGDVFIALMNYASHVGEVVSIDDTFAYSSGLEQGRLLAYIGWRIGTLAPDAPACTIEACDVWYSLSCYCYAEGRDPVEVFKERWETISQRDYVANPETGGRERENV